MNKNINKIKNLLEELIFLFESVEKLKNQYLKNGIFTEDEFNKILNLVPDKKIDKKGNISKVGKIGKWFLNFCRENNVKDPEKKFPRIETALKLLQNYLDSKITGFKIDLNSIKTFEDLKKLLFLRNIKVDVLDKNMTNAQYSRIQDKLVKELRADKERLNREAPILFENEDWIIRQPLTEPAGCLVGRGSQWCWSANSKDNYFHSYSPKDGLLMAIHNKHNPDIAFAIYFRDYNDENKTYKSAEFRDKEDKLVNTDPEKFLRFIGYNLFPGKNPYSIEDYKNGDDDFWKNLNKEDFNLGLLYVTPPLDYILYTVNHNIRRFKEILQFRQLPPEYQKEILKQLKELDEYPSWLDNLLYQDNLIKEMKEYLKELSPRKAFEYAIKNNDYEFFKSIDEDDIKYEVSDKYLNKVKDKRILDKLTEIFFKYKSIMDIPTNIFLNNLDRVKDKIKDKIDIGDFFFSVRRIYKEGKQTEALKKLITDVIDNVKGKENYIDNLVYFNDNFFKNDIHLKDGFSIENIYKMFKKHMLFINFEMNHLNEFHLPPYFYEELAEKLLSSIEKGEISVSYLYTLIDLINGIDVDNEILTRIYNLLEKNKDKEMIKHPIYRYLLGHTANKDIFEKIYKEYKNDYKINKIILSNNNFPEYRDKILNEESLDFILEYLESFNYIDKDLVEKIYTKFKDEFDSDLFDHFLAIVGSFGSYEALKYLKEKTGKKYFYFGNENIDLNQSFNLLDPDEVVPFFEDRLSDTFIKNYSIKDLKKIIKTTNYNYNIIEKILFSSKLSEDDKREILKIIDKKKYSDEILSLLKNYDYPADSIKATLLKELFLIDPINFFDGIFLFDVDNINLTPDLIDLIKEKFFNSPLISDRLFKDWSEVLNKFYLKSSKEVNKFIELALKHIKNFLDFELVNNELFYNVNNDYIHHVGMLKDYLYPPMGATFRKAKTLKQELRVLKHSNKFRKLLKEKFNITPDDFLSLKEHSDKRIDELRDDLIHLIYNKRAELIENRLKKYKNKVPVKVNKRHFLLLLKDYFKTKNEKKIIDFINSIVSSKQTANYIFDKVRHLFTIDINEMEKIAEELFNKYEYEYNYANENKLKKLKNLL